MFKKVGIATALSATVLFGGAFVSDVEASANSGSLSSKFRTERLFCERSRLGHIKYEQFRLL